MKMEAYQDLFGIRYMENAVNVKKVSSTSPSVFNSTLGISC